MALVHELFDTPSYVTFHLFFSMLQLIYTFSVNDLIEYGRKSPIFLFESPAPHSRDHLKNKYSLPVTLDCITSSARVN